MTQTLFSTKWETKAHGTHRLSVQPEIYSWRARAEQNLRINALSSCDFHKRSSSLSKKIPTHILCVALSLPRTPDVHCKQQYENLVFQQQKLHQITGSFVHTCCFRRMSFVVEFDVVNKEKCWQLRGIPWAQHSLHSEYLQEASQAACEHLLPSSVLHWRHYRNG